jgi:membrane protein
MFSLSPQGTRVLSRPGAFALQVIKAFNANQGLLLAGAVAYYALLSILPLLILLVITLSHFIDQGELLLTLRRVLEHVVPGQGGAIVGELGTFLQHRDVVGWVMLATLIFFGTLAFKVLENAISVIFLHRVAERWRPFWVSALLPFAYMVFLGLGLFVGTVMATELVSMNVLAALGYYWPDRVASLLLYLAGIIAEILIITSVYYLLPAVRIPVSHALIGGITAALLWEAVRRALVWYFGSLSQVNLVYGSLATSIIALLTLEIAATLLLIGAQVIAEYERFGRGETDGGQLTT